jgi:hypothetical protein
MALIGVDAKGNLEVNSEKSQKQTYLKGEEAESSGNSTWSFLRTFLATRERDQVILQMCLSLPSAILNKRETGSGSRK